MLLKDSAMESANYFGNKGEVQGVLCKTILLANLLESLHFLEILQTSVTFKNSEKVVKSVCFEKRLRWRALYFFEMTEGYKVSCVKILMPR